MLACVPTETLRIDYVNIFKWNFKNEKNTTHRDLICFAFQRLRTQSLQRWLKVLPRRAELCSWGCLTAPFSWKEKIKNKIGDEIIGTNYLNFSRDQNHVFRTLVTQSYNSVNSFISYMRMKNFHMEMRLKARNEKVSFGLRIAIRHLIWSILI